MRPFIDRRSFLRAAVGATAVSYGRILGANDRIRLGVVGCGNRGIYLMNLFQKMPGAEIGAVCDVFGEKCDKALQDAPRATGSGEHSVLLDDPEIDAIVVATPDHWHAPIAIDAMNAGKDVYVEKPLMFRREEGPEIIHTAKATGRVCQVGLQQRSGELFLRAKKEFVDSGLLGPVSSVRAEWNYSAPFDLGDANQPKPDTLNWDHFLGQVPYRAWNPHQYHHYRLFLDFGGAAITDLLTHWIDVVHMMLGQDSPRYVSSVGGIFVAKDDRTAPDTVSVIIEYPRFTVSFESTSLDGMPTEHLEFLGANGRLWLSRRKCQFISKDEGARPIAFEPPDMLVESHIRNFLDCCRSRRTPTCPPEVGELSARVCIAAKDAYVKRQQLPCAEST